MGCVLPCNDDYEEHSEKEEIEVEVLPLEDPVNVSPDNVTAVVVTTKENNPILVPEAVPIPVNNKKKKGKKDLAVDTTPAKPEQSAMVDVSTPINPVPKVTVTTPVRNLAVKFDLGNLDSPVFKGTKALQKFSNKSTFEPRFLWVNLHNQTLNLSEHMTKEKRHKEVGIKDIVSVLQALPVKNSSEKKKDADKLDVSRCLTVNFTKGGGIDLQFATNDEREAWYSALTKLMSTIV